MNGAIKLKVPECNEPAVFDSADIPVEVTVIKRSFSMVDSKTNKVIAKWEEEEVVD